ncbi:hypothetical protein Zmor_022509 [Zophobas morio]|uniref:Uncharacterized protein n=1 Tax=Zophobas morio TaxID=2755281 RepID=A0AA38HWH2_9CUCU|nr:hypothetical protein Zmor_022509 [Zophobas morio]
MYQNTVAVAFLCFLKPCIACDFQFDYSTKFGGSSVLKKHYAVKEITVTLPNIYGVSIENENIPRLCCNIFNLKSDVRYVIFDTCLIQQIEEECFSQKIEHLTNQIAITNNKLTSIKAGTFRNLKLEAINLENNLIEVIEDESFLNLTALTILNLSFNNLHALNSRAFMNLPQFGILTLQSNRIRTLQRNALYFFRKNYSQLDMKCNELTYIDKNALDGLVVENFELNLYENKLVSLPEGIFDQHSFSGIDVGRNPLRNQSKHFCSQNCTVQHFFFNCAGLNMESVGESVQNIGDWVEQNNVKLHTDDYCSFKESAKPIIQPWSICKSTGSVKDIWYSAYLEILVILYCMV